MKEICNILSLFVDKKQGNTYKVCISVFNYYFMTCKLSYKLNWAQKLTIRELTLHHSKYKCPIL